MSDPLYIRYQRWELPTLLKDYPGLSLRACHTSAVRIEGVLEFAAAPSNREAITDRYDIRIHVPESFPRAVPAVYELAGRIPSTFHTNPDRTLCLGSPFRLAQLLNEAPTLPGFVESCLIPYLYGFSFREKYGVLPFGELAHGVRGVLNEYRCIFGLSDDNACIEMIHLGSMKKREANQRNCPCGSGRRLGKCHNRVLNSLREQLGRPWFQSEYTSLSKFAPVSVIATSQRLRSVSKRPTS